MIFCPDAQLSNIIRQNLPLCQEASNCSSLHPSERLSNISRRRSVFDQQLDFFPKHIYEKTAATVQTMCVPVRTLSFIRQVVHSKVKPSGRHSSWSERLSFIYENCVHQINRPDNSCYGPNAPSLDMEIACS